MKLFTQSKASRKTKINSPLVLSAKHAWFLWLCQVLNIASIAGEISPWMLAIIILCLLWQVTLLVKHRRLTNNQTIVTYKARRFTSVAIIIFALLGCLSIALTAKQTGLLASMIHLLCFSYALKTFELKTRSDLYQLILLGLFILAAALIFKQTLAFSLVIVGLLIINLVSLLFLFSPKNNLFHKVKLVSVLLAQSAILAVILFLFFPRISPFWTMPTAKSAETGLSEVVTPGDIAKLTRSNKLAFRVGFTDGKLPSYSQLYWRAMVLENYDGREWRKNKSSLNYDANRVEPEVAIEQQGLNGLLESAEFTHTKPVNYQIILEPSFQKYLLALTPAKYRGNDQNIKPAIGFSFVNQKPITQAKSYQLSSYLNVPLSVEISENSKKLNLTYPIGSNVRLEALAQELQIKHPDHQLRAQAVLSLINQQEYFYTLEPPLLTNNSLDQFFFDTKAGFCVHYASAFTFLMRASGIPARLVTGYLGGEFNPSSTSGDQVTQGHFSIYQYDAHAWTEIWLQGKGWVRIDPTSAVNPERVNSGFSDQLLQERSSINNNLVSLYQLKNNPLFKMLRMQFDALDYQWSVWVVGFDNKKQYNLFKRWFGDKAPWKLALIIAGALIGSMLAFLLIMQYINRTPRKIKTLTTSQITFNKALTLFAEQGLNKPASMTVNNFAKEVRMKYPALAISFSRFSDTFNALNYQDLSDDKKSQLNKSLELQLRELMKQMKNNKNK